MAEIITRKDATAQGLGRYFTGRPCRHGHVAERLVCNATCIVCSYAVNARVSARRYAECPELFRERNAAYRAANPTNTQEYRAKSAAYREANREALRVYNREYRSRKRAEAATGLP